MSTTDGAEVDLAVTPGADSPAARGAGPEASSVGRATEGARGYAKGRLRHTAVVRAASDLFAAQGYESATILDIAAACGISRAGLLYHFPDKPSLLSAVLQDRDRADRARFAPYTSAPHGVGVLRGMVDLARHNQDVPGLVDLFARLSAEASNPEHPAHAYFMSRYARLRTGIARVLHQARCAGYLRQDVEVEDAAIRLTALSDGVQVQWLFDRDLDMAATLQRAILDLLTEPGRRALASVSIAPPA